MLIVLLNKSICIEKTLYISLCFKCLGFITKSYGLLSVDSTVYVVSMEIFILHISLCNIILFAPLQIPICLFLIIPFLSLIEKILFSRTPPALTGIFQCPDQIGRCLVFRRRVPAFLYRCGRVSVRPVQDQHFRSWFPRFGADEMIAF